MVIHRCQIFKMSIEHAYIHGSVFIAVPGNSHIGIMIFTTEMTVGINGKIRSPSTRATAKLELIFCKIRKCKPLGVFCSCAVLGTLLCVCITVCIILCGCIFRICIFLCS